MKSKIQKRIQARARTALGLDISSNSVALALLRSDKNGIRVVRAARRPLKAGLKKDLGALRRVAGELRRACKVKGMSATASLFSPRSLMQIAEIPASLTGPKGQYVQKEIKHYVALAGISIVSDYRDLYSTTDTERLLVVAADSEWVSGTVNNSQKGGVDVDVVEPHLLAYIRALYHQRIAGRFGCNVLLALLRDGKLTLAVMRERSIDFVRIHDIKDSSGDPEAVLAQLVAEIKIIMQYYEIEVADSTGHWEVNIVVDDDTSLPEQAQAHLSEVLEQVPVEILGSENMVTALSVDIPSDISSDQISAAAVGHAMRSLAEEIVLPKINCLPPLIREIKDVKRSMLCTAISAAVVLLIMGLVSMVLIQRGDQVRTDIAVQRPDSAVGEVVDLREALEAEIEQVGKIPKQLKEILGTQKSVNWARVLADVKKVIPENVSITRFDTRSDYTVFVDGVALTSNDVTRFQSRLGQSDQIETVDLVTTDYKSGLNGHHVYQIKCRLRTSVGI